VKASVISMEVQRDRAGLKYGERPRSVSRPPRYDQPSDYLISLLYAGTIDSSPFQEFLEALREHLSCDFAAFTIRPAYKGATPLIVMAGDETADFSSRLPSPDEHATLAHLDPLAAALRHPGDIYTLDEVIDWRVYSDTEFYRQIIAPYQIRYQIGMCFAEPSGWKCNIGLMNKEERKPFDHHERAALQRFTPHLEAALAIFARLRRAESDKVLFRETLDRLSIGTFLLDGAERVVEMNEAARALLSSNEELRFEDGRLALKHYSQSKDLRLITRAACGAVVRGNRAAPCFPLAIELASGRKLSVLVRAVNRSEGFVHFLSPKAIVYMSEPGKVNAVPEAVISRLLGLTAAESSVVRLLSAGMDIVGAAEELDITVNTVRTYTKRIFAKVGVSRQTELVQLVLQSVAPLA
jgi:DNA-binding CsgD family transcriptional regulator